MRKVHIFWYALFSEDGKSVSLGGVQTYLINLAQVFTELGYEVHYYRPADNDIDCEHYNIKMHGFKCNISKKYINKRIKATFYHFRDRIDSNKDIVLFAEDHLSCKLKGYKVISLQHGIYWDKPDYNAGKNKMAFAKAVIDRFRITAHRLVYSSYANLMVCVDYNYVNWYRAVMPYNKTKLVVIPNFAPVTICSPKPTDQVNIIFARRFEQFRGTRVFCEAIKKILDKYQDVRVTLAGWGSDEVWLHEQLDAYKSKVEFIRYKSEDSISIHANKHIAVVPTIGSEGTSLSLLEAMSCKCAVIGSDVGGITNIIIDGYNGLMVPAGNVEALYESIEFLVQNEIERNKIAERGYDTVLHSFSLEIWKRKWKKVIMENFYRNN